MSACQSSVVNDRRFVNRVLLFSNFSIFLYIFFLLITKHNNLSVKRNNDKNKYSTIQKLTKFSFLEQIGFELFAAHISIKVQIVLPRSRNTNTPFYLYKFKLKIQKVKNWTTAHLFLSTLYNFQDCKYKLQNTITAFPWFLFT